jgi:hypothetical protein
MPLISDLSGWYSDRVAGEISFNTFDGGKIVTVNVSDLALKDLSRHTAIDESFFVCRR